MPKKKLRRLSKRHRRRLERVQASRPLTGAERKTYRICPLPIPIATAGIMRSTQLRTRRYSCKESKAINHKRPPLGNQTTRMVAEASSAGAEQERLTMTEHSSLHSTSPLPKMLRIQTLAVTAISKSIPRATPAQDAV